MGAGTLIDYRLALFGIPSRRRMRIVGPLLDGIFAHRRRRIEEIFA
jgi:hypothetical protein